MGAYIYDEQASEWSLLTTMASMPAGDWGHEVRRETGVYEVAIAPSNSARIYLIAGGNVYRSDNRGRTFVRTGLTGLYADANDAFRMLGRKMTVDPANPDVVYVGTQKAGLHVSTDGGASWTRHPGIPVSQTDAGVLVAIDPSSPAPSGRSLVVYVASHGHGVFVSRDGGQNFTLTASSPRAPAHMVCDPRGTVWLTETNTGPQNLRKFRAGAWSSGGADDGGPFHSVAIDPRQPDHLVVASEGGTINQSFDGGGSWTGPYWLNYPAGSGNRVAVDVPWLAWTNESYMTNGDMAFDPLHPGRLIFAEGIGVWWTEPPSSYVGFNWTSMSKGIEQLCVNKIVVPPSGAPIVFCWDRPVFLAADPERYSARHGPSNQIAINMGWSGDYAQNDFSFVAAIFNWWGVDQSGYSVDGGVTWQQFGSKPSFLADGKIGGSLAVGTSSNFVWAPNNNGVPNYTRDRGNTWTQCNIPGVPTSGETGWGWAYFLHRHIVVADRVAPGVFYLYNYKEPFAGLYRSQDGGANWTRVYDRPLADWSNFNAELYAVPGHQGHLFFTSGQQDGDNPSSTAFVRSTDGGATWSAVSDVREVYACGFGKAAPGSDYPAIFIAGYVGREWGLWRSDDNAARWRKIGDYPVGNGDVIRALTGDMSIYGRAYVGFAGSGAAYCTVG
jgi:photosystem II stability/assembly factor-like uncharacterized protein